MPSQIKATLSIKAAEGAFRPGEVYSELSHSWNRHLSELCYQAVMTGKLLCHSQAFGMYDAFQVPQCLVQIVIDNNIVIFAHMADFLSGRSQAAADRFEAILSTVPQAHFQHFQGG